MSCDVGKETEGLENELWRRQSDGRAHSPTFFITSPTLQLIFQPFCLFTYITAYSPTLPLLHLHHSSFSNPSFASPMSQALHLIHLAIRIPCIYIPHGLSWPFWQLKFWNLSKWPSVGPDGTYEYRHRHRQLASWIKWRTCDVGEAKEGLENELWRRWSNGRVGEWAVM